MKSVQDIISTLKSMGTIKNIQGMTRFGIASQNNLGVSVTEIRTYARSLGKNHDLALQLWKTGIRDARMIAACIEEPKKVTKKQMENWVKDFNSWDICDHVCGHLFDKTPFAYDKAWEWSGRNEEFVKRAAFALMAWLAVHDKQATDEKFEQFFTICIHESIDERNYVKKAVSWALRNIGKRNQTLNKKALDVAKTIHSIDSKSARWIASDVLRELSCEKIQQRLKR